MPKASQSQGPQSNFEQGFQELNSDPPQPKSVIDMSKIAQNFQFDPTPGEDGDLILDDLEIEFENSPPLQEIKESRLGTEICPKVEDRIEEVKHQEVHKVDIKRATSVNIQQQQFLFCSNILTKSQLQKENDVLRDQLKTRTQEHTNLRDDMRKVQESLAKAYTTPQLFQNVINDQEIYELLSQGFLAQAKLHLAFMFSSPLILRYKDGESDIKTKTLMPIDHETELVGVVEGLKQTNNQIRYKRIPATLENLRITLSLNPLALHFSGHGIENNRENFGKDSILLRDAGNMLVFEDHEGYAQLLSEKMLHQLLESSGTKLEFVFVASCYSQFAGEIFHNAGARHVICIKRGEQIRDEASIIFSKAFYTHLFSQTVNVCKAFEFAKSFLLCNPDKTLACEAHKFVLLKDTDEIINTHNCSSFTFGSHFRLNQPSNQKKEHQCQIFGPFNKGQIMNIDEQPQFKLEVSKIEDFMGRRKDMQDVISSVMTQRLVTIKGIPGIGKTTLAKAAAYFLDERHSFKDGIIMLSLRGLHHSDMFLDRLFHAINKVMKVNEQKILDSATYQREKIMEFLKEKDILLVIDNAEDMLKEDGAHLKEFWYDLFNHCPKVKILLTSRVPIGTIFDITEKIIHLKELAPSFTMQLLIKKAKRPLYESEVHELLKANPTKAYHSNPFLEKKNQMTLEDHHMCELLAGHPHAISLVAPLLQHKSLSELYRLLNSQDLMDILKDEGVGAPLASLKVSLDASISHMEAHDPQAIKLFCLIGLMPGGCSEEDLNFLWGQNWVKYADKLLIASLLIKRNQIGGEIRYQLLPFMNRYAEELLEKEEKKEWHEKISKYFGDICKKIYRLNQKQNLSNQNEVMSKLATYETNIWACIYRICDKKTDNIYENLLGQSQTRNKSPAHSLGRSNLNWFESFGRSGDESSQQNNSFEIAYEEDHKIDAVLTQKTNSLRKSQLWHKQTISQRGNDQDSKGQEYDDQKEDTNSHSGHGQSHISSNSNNNEMIFEERPTLSQFKQNPALSQSQIVNQKPHLVYKNDDFLSSQKNFEESDQIFPTMQIANLLSDDQTSMNFQSPSVRMAKSKIAKLNLKLQALNQEDFYSDFEKSQNLTGRSKGSPKKQELNFEDTGEYPRHQSLLQNSNTIAKQLEEMEAESQNMHFIELEQSSNNTTDSEMISLNLYNQGLDQNMILGKASSDRRKSVRPLNAPLNMEEIKEEHSICLEDEMDEEEEPHSAAPILKNQMSKKLSSKIKKNYEEDSFSSTQQSFDESSQIPDYQLRRPNISQKTSLNKSQFDQRQKKIVKFQVENENDDTQLLGKFKIPQSRLSHNVTNKKKLAEGLTSEGSLIVYYVSNLCLQKKFKEASKAIDLIGKQIEDSLFKANMKRLEAYVLYCQGEDYQSAGKLFDEANKLYKEVESFHGQAVCCYAMGFILFSKVIILPQKKQQTETQNLNNAKRRMEEALYFYDKIDHFQGASECHRLLGLIKNKMVKQGKNDLEHHKNQMKLLAKKDQDLQREGN